MNPRIVGRCFRTLFYSLLLSPLPFFQTPNIAHAEQAPIIGEINWAGSTLSAADEWIELWNDSDEPLTLAGYTLQGASPSDIVFDATQIIPARGTFLIANYAQDDEKSAVATSVQLITTAISLSNSELKIELLAPDGTLIDSAGDGNSPPAGSSIPSKTSMIRAVDNTWLNATSSQNLKESVADLATPGFCDACGTPAAPEPIVEPEPIIETPTSTEPVLEPLVGTSSTTETVTSTSIVPILDTPTPTIELPIQQPEPPPVTTTTIVTTPTPAPSPTSYSLPPIALTLHAIFPAPESGDEWIELRAPTSATLTQAEGWTLRDASAVIYRFASTNDRVIITENTWRISLASSRLNNSGDTVELIRPDGSVAERMTFPETARGTGWIKNIDNTGWIQDPPPTVTPAPTATQTITSTEPLPSVAVPPTIELPVTIATTTHPETASIKPIKTPAPAKPKTTTTVKKTPAKKVTTKKVDSAPPLVTLDMLTQLEPEIRVTLEGTVGTIPGILSKNQFTLHTPDGRGLLVRGTSKQTSPEFGSHIRLTGTLSLNDDGLSLKMLTKDKWVKLGRAESIHPRVVDLLAPSQEDAWSLIQVTGTVLDTGSGRVNLELGGVPITVKIRPATGYRAERLSKGDTVRITGIVDTRGEEPLLYPRQISEVEIIAHAKLAPAGTGKTAWPAWTPFGAAGITIAATEGYKRLRRLAKDRKLRKLAALAQ